MIEFIKLICIGLVLGITVVIPGLSAGTMAIVFNVYDRLVGVITPNLKKLFVAWKFWLPLVIGGFTGVIFLSKVVTILYENYPTPTMWFFIGLIVGSIPLIYIKTKEPASAFPSPPSVIAAVIGIAIMIIMAIVRPEEGATVHTELTLQVFALLALGGALAGIAIIIPGISGAFLLLVIGLYMTALQAVSDLNISLLVPIALGAILGIFIGAGFIRFLLAKVPRPTYGAVFGLVSGSIIVLFPGNGFGEGVTIIFSILCLLAGAALSFCASRKEKID
jgi:putative membrane protein